jgi:hypothetical protein
MVIVPRAFALTLCERMDVNPATGQISLIGIFNYRRFPSYPTPPQRITAYTVLHDGLGEGTMELAITHAGTDQEFVRLQRWFAMTDRLQMVNLEIIINCVFPAPGRYLFDLRFERQPITTRSLDLK